MESNKGKEQKNDLKTDELIAQLEQEKNYVETYDPKITLKYPKINMQAKDDTSNLLGKRVELNEKTATIRYVGPLRHKKDAKETEIWLGLEWDDKTRGKHNGTVESYEYFKTKNNEKSGSLIKMTKVNVGQTFKGALGYKYNFYEEEGNEYHKDVDKALEKDNFIVTDKKIINIELVGKEKAAKKFSEFAYMPCIDLSYSYINQLGNDLSNILPRLKELSLTRTLLTKWSDFLSLLLQFKNLTLLNFSENILIFDELFEEQIQKFMSGEYKQHLNTLVLNNCNLDVYHLVKLSPLFTQLDYLYLKDNKINPETYEQSENKKYIDENLSNIEKYTPNLKYLSLEHNKINIFFFGYKLFKSPKLKYINMNQNLVSELISKNNADEDKKLLELFKKSMQHISLDYNMFKKEDYLQIMVDLESMELKDIDILNNGFIDKIGVSKVKTEMIGRNPQLTILNNTTITKIMRRDAEKQYLIELVKEYINSLGNKAFDKFVFEKYMEKYHKQYFILKKKFFDPLDDYENLTKKNNTNTMKSNMAEIVLQFGEKTINKKFPKSTVFTNLKNLCVRLFKIDGDALLSFYLKNNDKEELIEDETITLQSLNLPPKQIILIKKK
jgi:hypothetical protein